MTDYRAYVVGSDGHVAKAIQLDCRDDNTAIESAKQLLNGHDIELWQRDRRIARFDTHAKDTTGWLQGEDWPDDGAARREAGGMFADMARGACYQREIGAVFGCHHRSYMEA